MGFHFLLQRVFSTQGLNTGSCIAGRFFTVWATREAPAPPEDPLLSGQRGKTWKLGLSDFRNHPSTALNFIAFQQREDKHAFQRNYRENTQKLWHIGGKCTSQSGLKKITFELEVEPDLLASSWWSCLWPAVWPWLITQVQFSLCKGKWSLHPITFGWGIYGTSMVAQLVKESICNAGDPGSIPGWGSSPGEGIGYPFQYSWASLVAQVVKNLTAMQETWVLSLGWEDPLEEGSPVFLSGESPWTEEPSRLQSMGSQRVRHNWVTKHSPAQGNYEWGGGWRNSDQSAIVTP